MFVDEGAISNVMVGPIRNSFDLQNPPVSQFRFLPSTVGRLVGIRQINTTPNSTMRATQLPAKIRSDFFTMSTSL